MKADVRKVALLVETSRSYGRGLLQGIAKYSRLNGPWSLYIVPGDFKQALPRMREWGGTGIIARIEDAHVAKAIRETGLPTIGLDLPMDYVSDVNGTGGQISEIHPNPVAAAELAGQHLLERAFVNFAFVGYGDRIWSNQRREAFTNFLKRHGYECRLFEPGRAEDTQETEWSTEQKQLADWLTNLPKPTGIFACDDERGRQVLEAALAAELRVPDDIAVVGVDDDELLCQLCYPPLSSVALDSERGGYAAAALLDDMMSGKVQTPQRLLIEPLRVSPRESTDVLAVKDNEVAYAFRFIRANAAQKGLIEKILDELPISRRLLEMRFRKAVGRTMYQQVQIERLALARQFLIGTDLSIEQIAVKSGFNNSSHLGRFFKQVYGTTPARFRVHG